RLVSDWSSDVCSSDLASSVARGDMHSFGATAVRQALLSPADALQRGVGNESYGRLVGAKLVVGAPGDSFEQEADRIADAVVSARSEERRVGKEGSAGW